MNIRFKKLNAKQLPLNDEMLSFWNEEGFLVIEQFYDSSECDNLRNRSKELINDFEHSSVRSIFDTNDQKHAEDDYFLESGDKIRFFFEKNAFDKNGKLNNSIDLVINKIGHALHDLDSVFFNFSHREELNNIALSIGIRSPKLLQSMYIFKQPHIGGEVACHQDSTFLYTKPESAVGFWVALENATIENGCLWVARGKHKGPLRKLFTKINGNMQMITLDSTPFEKTDTAIEVKKGSLVLLHGRLPHYSCENKSKKSRHAYSLHIIDGKSVYPKENWLQRPAMPLKGFI